MYYNTLYAVFRILRAIQHTQFSILYGGVPLYKGVSHTLARSHNMLLQHRIFFKSLPSGPLRTCTAGEGQQNFSEVKLFASLRVLRLTQRGAWRVLRRRLSPSGWGAGGGEGAREGPASRALMEG